MRTRLVHRERATLPAKKLAALIANVVVRAVPHLDPTAKVAYSHVIWHGFPDELRPLLQRITVERWAKGHTLWQSPQGGIISVTSDEVASCIAAKESKLSTYRGAWDEIWLLIHATDYLLSGTMDLLPDAIEASYDTGFDRVYVLSPLASP